MGQQRPGHASHFVDECRRYDFEGSPRQELREPGMLLRVFLGAPQDGMCADDKNASHVVVPCLEIGPSFCLSPVESCPGTSPIQAAKSRADRKNRWVRYRRRYRGRPDDTDTGMVSGRLLAWFERCCALIRFSIDPINVCTA
jgi:hypothetical protein